MSYMKSYPVRSIFLILAYILSARLGLTLLSVSDFATLIWIPTGLSFAAIFLWGLRYLPAIFVGAVITNFMTGGSAWVALAIGTGNTLEAFAGVWIFTRFIKKAHLQKVKHVLYFIPGVALGSTMISATIGVLTLELAGFIPQGYHGKTWLAWWLGDSLSNLVFSPLFILWAKPPKLNIGKKKIIEGLILSIGVIGLSLSIFHTHSIHSIFKPYWIFMLMIWATLRFGQHANVLLTFILSVIAVTGTLRGLGPYQSGLMTDSILHLELYIMAVSVAGLFFGALGREKDEAVRVRTEFLSIASHELRTPITSLGLSLTLLKSTLGEDAGAEVRSIITAVDRQLGKLNSHVDTLFNITRMESKDLSIDRREIDLSAYVTDVMTNLKDLFDHSRCPLVLDIHPGVKVFCDPYGVEQVLTNLSLNAMKYAAGKPVTVSLSLKGDSAVLSVKDEGKGIDPAFHQLIFERYQRVDKQSSRTGLGLGLYISKLIVDAHQGKISVSSEMNKGSQFVVELPVRNTSSTGVSHA